MKSYSEIAERQADHVIAEAAAGRFTSLLRLVSYDEDFTEEIARIAMKRAELVRAAMLDHCEEALIRQYDEETEAQKDAYAKGER